MMIDDEADGGWSREYAVGAARQGQLLEPGLQAYDQRPSVQVPPVFAPSQRNADLAEEDWGELNETNGTRRRDLANLRQQSPEAGAESRGSAEDDRDYQEMLNEAIIQSVLEQSKKEGSCELALPS